MKDLIMKNIAEHEEELVRLRQDIVTLEYVLEKDKNRLKVLEEKDDDR